MLNAVMSVLRESRFLTGWKSTIASCQKRDLFWTITDSLLTSFSRTDICAGVTRSVSSIARTNVGICHFLGFWRVESSPLPPARNEISSETLLIRCWHHFQVLTFALAWRGLWALCPNKCGNLPFLAYAGTVPSLFGRGFARRNNQSTNSTIEIDFVVQQSLYQYH